MGWGPLTALHYTFPSINAGKPWDSTVPSENQGRGANPKPPPCCATWGKEVWLKTSLCEGVKVIQVLAVCQYKRNQDFVTYQNWTIFSYKRNAMPISPACPVLFDASAGEALVPGAWHAGWQVSFLPPWPIEWCPFPGGQVLCSRSTSFKSFLTLSGMAPQPSQPAVCSHCPAIPGSQGCRLGCFHLLNHFIFIFGRLIFVERTFVGFLGFSYGGLMYFSLEKR